MNFGDNETESAVEVTMSSPNKFISQKSMKPISTPKGLRLNKNNSYKELDNCSLKDDVSQHGSPVKSKFGQEEKSPQSMLRRETVIRDEDGMNVKVGRPKVSPSKKESSKSNTVFINSGVGSPGHN